MVELRGTPDYTHSPAAQAIVRNPFIELHRSEAVNANEAETLRPWDRSLETSSKNERLRKLRPAH